MLALEKLKLLFDHYSGNGPLAINKERCNDEYTELSTFITGHAILKQCKSVHEFAREFLCRDTLCELFLLFQYMLFSYKYLLQIVNVASVQ